MANQQNFIQFLHNMTYFFLIVFVMQVILHLVDLHKIYKPYYTISCLHDLIHVSFLLCLFSYGMINEEGKGDNVGQKECKNNMQK